MQTKQQTEKHVIRASCSKDSGKSYIPKKKVNNIKSAIVILHASAWMAVNKSQFNEIAIADYLLFAIVEDASANWSFSIKWSEEYNLNFPVYTFSYFV